jgi:plasmid maintenance system antidote protein VapI
MSSSRKFVPMPGIAPPLVKPAISPAERPWLPHPERPAPMAEPMTQSEPGSGMQVPSAPSRPTKIGENNKRNPNPNMAAGQRLGGKVDRPNKTKRDTDNLTAIPPARNPKDRNPTAAKLAKETEKRIYGINDKGQSIVKDPESSKSPLYVKQKDVPRMLKGNQNITPKLAIQVSQWFLEFESFDMTSNLKYAFDLIYKELKVGLALRKLDPIKQDEFFIYVNNVGQLLHHYYFLTGCLVYHKNAWSPEAKRNDFNAGMYRYSKYLVDSVDSPLGLMLTSISVNLQDTWYPRALHEYILWSTNHFKDGPNDGQLVFKFVPSSAYVVTKEGGFEAAHSRIQGEIQQIFDVLNDDKMIELSSKFVAVFGEDNKNIISNLYSCPVYEYYSTKGLDLFINQPIIEKVYDRTKEPATLVGTNVYPCVKNADYMDICGDKIDYATFEDEGINGFQFSLQTVFNQKSNGDYERWYNFFGPSISQLDEERPTNRWTMYFEGTDVDDRTQWYFQPKDDLWEEISTPTFHYMSKSKDGTYDYVSAAPTCARKLEGDNLDSVETYGFNILKVLFNLV